MYDGDSTHSSSYNTNKWTNSAYRETIYKKKHIFRTASFRRDGKNEFQAAETPLAFVIRRLWNSRQQQDGLKKERFGLKLELRGGDERILRQRQS